MEFVRLMPFLKMLAVKGKLEIIHVKLVHSCVYQSMHLSLSALNYKHPSVYFFLIFSTEQLMGMEECKNGDEECEKRRLLSEAHLDYIYTQGHHKP
jgi:Phytosulfokine precursor protein (PSK)